jgi:hypothetical protein
MKRLIDELPPGLEARLLQAAEQDTPGARGQDRALAAAMATLAASAATASSASAAVLESSQPQAGAGTSATASAAKGGVSAWLGKTLLVLTLGAVAAGAYYGAGETRAPSNEPPAAPTASVPRAPEPATLPLPSSSDLFPLSARATSRAASDGSSASASAAGSGEPPVTSIGPRAQSERHASRARRGAAPGSTQRRAASVQPTAHARAGAASPSSLGALGPAHDLTDQIRQLDRARAELARANAQEALVAVQAYARRWPEGAFRIEAEVLEVEALVAAGRRSEATALARKLLARPEGAAYRARIAPVLSSAPPP